MINRSTIIALAVAVSSALVAMGTVVFAQTYSWVPLGVAASVWGANGQHIYNTNPGAVVVGGTTPSGSLLLDVAGSIGGTSFCDQNGNNCFQPQNVKWKLVGSNLHNTNPANVGVGNSAPAYKLDVNGPVRGSAFLYSSDRRLKTDITPLTNAVDIVNNLHPVSFDWKASKKPALGLIAQEVEQVLPQVVHTGTDGYKSVDYVSLIAPLIAVVKEQEQEIQLLEEQALRQGQCNK